MQLVCMMATPTVNSPQSPANSNDSDGQQPLTVNTWVAFYTKTQANGKRKKARTATTKEMITKEFVHLFVNDEVNYHSFLQMILDKHHFSKYEVAQQAVFPYKVQVLPAKWVNLWLCSVTSILIICYYSSKSNATYIINFDEYNCLVTKINKRMPFQPIAVFVEMPQVEKVFSKVSRANLCVHHGLWLFTQQKKARSALFLASDDEEGDGPAGDDSDGDEVSLTLHAAHSPFTPYQNHTQDSLGLTKIDHELGQFCWKLEKKYGTDHDGTYSYIDPVTGTTIPLIPFMRKEWACAMVSSALADLAHILTQYGTSMMVWQQWTTLQTHCHSIQEIASHHLVHRTTLCLQAWWSSLHCQLSHHYSHLLHHSCTWIMSSHCLPPLVWNSTAHWPAPLSTPHWPSSTPHWNWNAFSKLQSRTVSGSGFIPPHALGERVWARYHAPCQCGWPWQHWHVPRWFYPPEGDEQHRCMGWYSHGVSKVSVRDTAVVKQVE